MIFEVTIQCGNETDMQSANESIFVDCQSWECFRQHRVDFYVEMIAGQALFRTHPTFILAGNQEAWPQSCSSRNSKNH